MFGDHDAIRALVRFAEEEIKHQQLFWRYLEAFRRDFVHPCEVLGSAASVAQVILSKTPMAVMLVTLHLEIMTQSHFTESIRPDAELDPLFARLLKHHWLEECQHAKIDALELEKMVAMSSPDLIDKAFVDYMELIDAFDGLLTQQAAMDAKSLEVALGRSFDEEQTARIVQAQHDGYRQAFLVSGMSNPHFTKIAKGINADGASRIAQKAANLS